MIRGGFFISALTDRYLTGPYLFGKTTCYVTLARPERRFLPMKIILTLALPLATFLTTNVYGAAVTTYSSRPTFLDALSESDNWSFNGPEGNPVIILNSLGTNIVGVSTQGGDAQGKIHENALCGSVGGAVDCFPPVVLTLLEPRNAFGFDNLDFTDDEEAVVNITFANGDPSQQFVFDLGAEPPFTPIFFGVTSDQPIATVSVYSRDPGTADIGLRANVIDNVTVGNAVPEPVTLVLLILASASLCLRRTRAE
jgi:hypothetical protein